MVDLIKKELVKEAYLAGDSTLGDICNRFDVAFETLRDWIRNGRHGDTPWSVLRKERQMAQKRELMDKASLHLPSVFKTGSEILEYGLKKIHDSLVAGKYEGSEVEVIKTTADIMLKVYKVLRLDSGQSTSNTAIAVSHTEESENLEEVKTYLKSALGEDVVLDA